jgi:hypothetical protein
MYIYHVFFLNLLATKTQKQCDIIESCQQPNANLCSLHASLQSVSPASQGLTSSTEASGGNVVYQLTFGSFDLSAASTVT